MKISVLTLTTAAILAFPMTAVAADIIIDADQQPRFHDYVVKEHHNSFEYKETLGVGTVLPEKDIEYYDVPTEYSHAHAYKYTIVNNRTVLVDPGTRRIVEVIN